MAPTLATANRRKWWIAITAITENLLFAAVLLGWSSLLLMLKNEGFYSYKCNELLENSTTPIVSSNSSTETMLTETGNNTNSEVRVLPSGYLSCAAQDVILNRYYTIGSTLLSAVTIILGVIMDKYGSRMIRLCGSLMFATSCVLFAVGSIDPDNLSILMAPAVCLNGAGGITYIFTSFPIPNFFADLRATMIAFMIGSYSASALLYMIFKVFYDMGVSFQMLMGIHAGLAILTFVNAYANQPWEPIPGPMDLSYRIEIILKEKEARKNGLKLPQEGSVENGKVAVSQQEGLIENEKHVKIVEPSEESDSDVNDAPHQTFVGSMTTWCYFFSVVTMALTQIRLISYMGWLELYVRSSAERQGMSEEEISDSVDYYARIFGLLQANCFLMAPVVGQILDYKLKQDKNDALKYNKDTDKIDHDVNGNEAQGMQRNLKKQSVSNLFRAFFICNTMLTLFGVIVLFDMNLPIQIVAMVLHTIIRTFLHSSTGALYGAVYHFSHFGKLTGVTSFLGAMAILVLDPWFVDIMENHDGNPWIYNMILLVATVLGYGLPLVLFREYRAMDDYLPVASADDCDVIQSNHDLLQSNASIVNKITGKEEGVTLSTGALVF